MPKLTKDIEDKIAELIDQELKDSEISRKLGVHRTTVANRREAHLKRKANQTKPEKGPETNIQHEHTDFHPLDPKIYTLMRHQGTNSRELAISQAIETQHSFNPYVLNHGLKTPKELIQYFENKSHLDSTKVKDLTTDLDIEIRISRGLVLNLIEENKGLKELAEERYEEGLEKGRKDHAIYVRCVHCREIIQVTPLSKMHNVITQFLHDNGWGHKACVRNDEYNRGAGSRELETVFNRS